MNKVENEMSFSQAISLMRSADGKKQEDEDQAKAEKDAVEKEQKDKEDKAK